MVSDISARIGTSTLAVAVLEAMLVTLTVTRHTRKQTSHDCRENQTHF